MKKLIIANWKMTKSSSEVKSWFKEFDTFLPSLDLSKVTIAVAPSFPYLELAGSFKHNLLLCAQDVSTFATGPKTSQVSASQVKEYCNYSLVGHSETKVSFEDACKKALLCMQNDITPVVCIADFEHIQHLPDYLLNAVIALEDSSDISVDGVYKPVSVDVVSSRVKAFTQKFGSDFLGLLYGGSVNGQNASELSKIVGLTGLLVGNASLIPSQFFEVIKNYIT